MASIDCQKMTAKNCGGMRRHLDDEIRENGQHANKNINQELTHLNSWVGCSDFSEMENNMQNNIAEIDRLHPPKRVKSDRNINVSFYMVCPKELTDQGKSEEFFRSAYDFIDKFCAEKYGKSYPCGMAVHRDEIHEYLDHGWKERTSLEHGHMWVTPYARWMDQRTVYDADGKPLREAPAEPGKKGKIVKENYMAEGLNCKHFLNQSFLKELQQEFDRHVFREFGIHYMTGEKALHMTVEELKADSEHAKVVMERAEKERDRVLEQAKACQKGGSYTNEQGESEFISYGESLDYLEQTREHLTENAKAYQVGGWYFDYETSLGVSIPEGGIDHLVSEAAAESERITAEANERVADVLDHLEEYESSQKALIDDTVKMYEEERLKPLKDEFEPLQAKINDAKEELKLTLDRIAYYKGDKSDRIYGSRNQDGTFIKAPTLADVRQEIADKQERLNIINRGSQNFRFFCQDWAIESESITEQAYAVILGGLAESRLNMSDLPLELKIRVSEEVERQWEDNVKDKYLSLNREIDNLDMDEILNSSLTRELVEQVQKMTIEQLEERDMLKCSAIKAKVNIDYKPIIEKLKFSLTDFIEKVKNKAQELVRDTIHHGKSRG